MKETISTVTGVAAGVISWLVGGLDTTILALVICMGVDYVTGLIVAGIFHNSPKTPSGGLDSRVGWKGLARKFVTLLIVVVQISWTRCWAWAMSGMRSSWGSVPTSASASWKMRGTWGCPSPGC